MLPFSGLMVDPARRYLTPKTLRAMLDGMATEKLNVMHLHLTDDQSFPLQLPSHPELAAPFAPRLNYSATVRSGAPVGKRGTVVLGGRKVPPSTNTHHARPAVSRSSV